jgi:uncharacterized protein involved in exopolysaccharide biosynthesis
LVIEERSSARSPVARERRRTLRRLLGCLNAKLEKATTREAIFRLQENEISTAMIASAQRDYAFRVIDPAITPEALSYRWPRGGPMMFAGAVFGLLSGAVAVTAPRARSRLL